MKIVLPAMNIPAIAISTVAPEIEHGLARGRRRAQQRVARLCARPPLLALAAEVEERVVDADGHADEQDHGLGHVRRRQHVGEERVEPEGGEHGGEREQHRQAGRDERAEREQEDEQRDRDREQLGVREVLVERLVDLVVRARVADSSTVKAGWPACAPATASRIGWTLSLALSGSPLMSNWTSAECPSFEIWVAESSGFWTL